MPGDVDGPSDAQDRQGREGDVPGYRALLEAAVQWRAVFENSAIGVALTDLEGRFCTVNPAYEKMLGYSEAELQALTFLDLTHEDHRDFNWSLVTELLAGKRERFQIDKQYRPQGRQRHLGEKHRLPGARRRDRAALPHGGVRGRHRTETRGRGAATERGAVAEMGRQDSHSGWVFEHQRPLFRHDLEVEARHPIERRLLEEGVRSYCVVPLTLGGKTLGTLNIGSQHKNQYCEADAEFLREVASQVALAIGNMQAYEEIGALKTTVECTAERYRTLLEINNAIVTHLTRDALLHSVSEALHRIIPFDRAAFTLYNPARETFRYLAMEGPLPSECFHAGMEFHRTETVAARVFDQQRPVLRRDLEREQEYPNDRRLVAEGIVTDCLVPLIVGGRSIGTLNVGSTTPDCYSEEDVGLLQELGNQVALAVENMQSYEEIAALKARLEKENIYLQEEIRTEHNFEEIVGGSPALLAVLYKLEQVARTDSTVLICGETGTGKELIARAIHARSPRNKPPSPRGWSRVSSSVT